MSEGRWKLEELAPWAITPLPRDIQTKGPWGQLNAWDHPGLDESAKRYVTGGDVWIHASGQTYYMHLGTQHAFVTLPGPSCSCKDFQHADACIHVHVVNILRSPIHGLA